jgi:biotin carboxylase
MKNKRVVVQLGMTSDDCAAYADAANTLGFEAWLVEGTDQRVHCSADTMKRYGKMVSVDDPTDSDEVIDALVRAQRTICAVVPGNDACVAASNSAARALGLRAVPFGKCLPPDKAEQRKRTALSGYGILQPRFRVLEHADVDVRPIGQHVGFPLIVKPVQGNGGLGVCLVSSESGLRSAISAIRQMKNGYRVPFEKLLVEEYVNGEPCSVQGLAIRGRAELLTYTCQLMDRQRSSVPGADCGFEEYGHIVRAIDGRDAMLRIFGQLVVSALKYQNGPFYIDMVRVNDNYYMIETGFRLSAAGVARKVDMQTGSSWAVEVIRVLTNSCSAFNPG